MNRSALFGIVGIVGIVLLVTLFLGYGAPPAPEPSEKLPVVTSFYPLYFFAKEIGGDKADVHNITPAGAEPHEYEPTAQDIARIENSKLLVINGALEAWAPQVLQTLDTNVTLYVTAGEAVMTQNTVEGGEEIRDPHVWLSPALAQNMADKISAGYEQVDPANAAYYRANADALKAKLAALDSEYQTGLAQCERRDFITSHAAFGYLASLYSLNQVSISGVSPEMEPSSQELAAITRFAREKDVKYIFFESLTSPKLAETLATEVGAQTLVLNPLEGLTDEEMAAGKDYFTEMRANLENLKVALECHA